MRAVLGMPMLMGRIVVHASMPFVIVAMTMMMFVMMKQMHERTGQDEQIRKYAEQVRAVLRP